MYYFKLLNTSDISARKLILSLMNVADIKEQEIGQLVKCSQLFGIEKPTIRVAATRLLKEGMLASNVRGVYTLGPKSLALSSQLSAWREINSKLRPWDGGWITVHTTHLGRTNRKRLRACNRALKLNGYVEAYLGFFVRPSNLGPTLEQHRKDLISIGLDENAIITKASDVSLSNGADWKSLWTIAELSEVYKDANQAMSASKDKLDSMALEDAARETLLVGQSVIQAINYDPLLPHEISHTDLFNDMLLNMQEYDEIGRAYWDEYLAI